MSNSTPIYQNEIQQMMFVFGEVQDPLDETLVLVEDLVRSWKDVRKNVKDKESAPVDEELIDDEVAVDKGMKIKKMNIHFSWDHLYQYSAILEEDEDEVADLEEKEAYEDQLKRLQVADRLTRSMTKEQYIRYSECRQASFTYKKLKRFRDWCEMSKFYDLKGNSDVIDSLGFLCHEAVGTITTTALQVKQREDESNLFKVTNQHVPNGLFQKPLGEKNPLQPKHIQEAYRILQLKSLKKMGKGFGTTSFRRPTIII